MSSRAAASSCRATSRKRTGSRKDEADRQLRNWERNLAVEYDESDLVIDDDEPTPINGQR